MFEFAGSSYSLPSDRPSSPEAPSGLRIGSMGNRSLKGSSGSGNGNVGSSLGSHYASANSGCSSDRGSGGKRSLNSGSSMESNRDFSSLTTGAVVSGITKQMNMFLRTKSDSGKRLSDEVSYIVLIQHFFIILIGNIELFYKLNLSLELH